MIPPSLNNFYLSKKLVLFYLSRDTTALVHLIAPIVRILAYSFALLLHQVHTRKGVVTSGALFTFWLLEALLGAVTFRSVLMSGYATGEDRLTPFTNYLVQYSLVVVMFFFSCWADPKPTYVTIDRKVGL